MVAEVIIVDENRADEQFNFTGWDDTFEGEPRAPAGRFYDPSISFGFALMGFSILGNICVFVMTLSRIRLETKTITTHVFLLNLAMADIVVTCVFLPVQAGWIKTRPWNAGDAACRIFAFFRIFGRYLSGNVTICISVDQLLVALRPTGWKEGWRRAKVMLSLAWVVSLSTSAIEATVHHIHSYPWAGNEQDCTVFGTFSSRSTELAYAATKTMLLSFLPLTVILVCYMSIWCKMSKEKGGELRNCRGRWEVAKVKKRTLRHSIMIVVTFLVCWTPPFVMHLWTWIDPVTASTVDPQVRRVLLLFTCGIATLNPILYGYFFLKRN